MRKGKNMDISSIKQKGKDAFKTMGAYWTCVGVSFVTMLFTGGSGGSGGSSASGRTSELTEEFKNSDMDWSALLAIFAVIVGVLIVGTIVGLIIQIFVSNILQIGCASYYTNLIDDYDSARGVTAAFGDLGNGYKNNFKRNALAMFMMHLFVFLWSLLFIIPGIIASYKFRLVPYILAENPDMTWKEALDMSKEEMDGHKMDAFVLDLSFIGWGILSLFTCGILSIFYVTPYIHASQAAFYRELVAAPTIDMPHPTFESTPEYEF